MLAIVRENCSVSTLLRLENIIVRHFYDQPTTNEAINSRLGSTLGAGEMMRLKTRIISFGLGSIFGFYWV